MRNYKLTIEYDGSDFYGWQVQPGRRTVQGELYRALEEFGPDAVKVVGAGRTDAGVHASGQVASVKADLELDCVTMRKALNAKLPKDIMIRNAEQVPLSFNARFDAKRRTYQYIFIMRKSALWRRYFLSVPDSLDVDRMHRALLDLPGERDFSSFASAGDDCSSKRCNLMRADLIENKPLLIFEVTADHFLYNMVRAMAGTLLDIGRGREIDLDGIVRARDRSLAGSTLPPYALYLIDVCY